ncbi:MAG: hypothetical protein IT207_01365 [Fimbriimonadaceae bacterium]|nr:hypothetical protein [Fimbriimonadaceae bacterium]
MQITGRISNHELPVLILHQDAAVVPLNGPQPLPDFNAPVSSDPLTSQEEAALTEIFGMYCLTGFANPDAGTDSAYYDQLGEWMSQATFDSSIENRFNSIPFAEYHDPDECTIEGLSLYEIWYRHRTPGLISGGGGGGDNVNDCLFEIGLAIFMFLLGQIVARTTPQAMRLAREEIRTIVRNNGVRTAGANLVAALAAYTASGRHQELTVVLRRISDFVVAMVPLLPGAFYRVIRNAYRWWDYVASIGLSAAFIARAAKFVLTAYSLATALTKIYKACT